MEYWTELEESLLDRLEKVDGEDRDFVIGVMSVCYYEDDIRTMIDFIDNTDNVSKMDIIKASVVLHREREGTL